MSEPFVVHHHRVAIPEIDGRQVARQDLLRFDVVLAPFLLIGTLRRVVAEGIELRIGVVAAICALWGRLDLLNRSAGCTLWG